MTRFWLSRLWWSLATLFGISLVAFLLVALAPGDPVSAELRFLGVPSNPATVDALRREYGLDAPLPLRYGRWLYKVATLDLGASIASGRPVAAEFARVLPSTSALAFVSLLLIILLSISTGIVGALSTNRFVGMTLQALVIGVVSIPLYWLALTTVVVGSSSSLWSNTLMSPDSFSNLLMASALLSLARGLSIGRALRQQILDQRLEDYVRLGTAIGLPPGAILRQDISRVIAPSLITMWGNSFGFLLGGSVVVERIFDRSGLGGLALQAIATRDYPVLQAFLLLAGALFVAVNWMGDILGAWIDPRLRRRGIHA